MHRFCIFIFLMIKISYLDAQVFSSNMGGSVVDDGRNFTDFTIEVQQLDSLQLNQHFGLTQVCFNLKHGDLGQVKIQLISPDSQMVDIAGGLFAADCNVCLDMKAGQYIGHGWGPYNGTHRPLRNFGKMNSGGRSNGIWTLRIKDYYSGVQGFLESWSIQFGTNPPFGNKPYLSSALPILKINTNRQEIVDYTKRTMELELIDKGLGATNYFTDSSTFKHAIGIEIRGSSSQWFPKKSFGFEFLDSLGEDQKVELLGMPAESDWILSASFTDKGFINNVLAYDLFRALGWYASRTRYVELVINGEHQGLYVLMEKIKQDNNRVDISKLTSIDSAGSDVTGGYIFKIDKTTGGNGAGWFSKIAPIVNPNNQTILFQYHYPSDENITEPQKKYIQEFVDQFEQTLQNGPLHQKDKGWRLLADESSFIHYFLLNEISRNTDGYRLSTFLYKTKDTKGNKLYIGPPWDFDIAFGNINYCDGQKTTGWAVDFGNLCPGDNFQLPFWWSRLLSDSLFINGLQCEYKKLRASSWSNDSILHLIDQHVENIFPSAQENFDLWPILGLYIWPNPYPYPANYSSEIIELKNWLILRLQWMDRNMPGICLVSENKNATQAIVDADAIQIIPNPSTDQIKIDFDELDSKVEKLQIYNMHGQILFDQFLGASSQLKINLQPFNSGIYYLKIQLSNNQLLHKTFVKI